MTDDDKDKQYARLFVEVNRQKHIIKEQQNTIAELDSKVQSLNQTLQLKNALLEQRQQKIEQLNHENGTLRATIINMRDARQRPVNNNATSIVIDDPQPEQPQQEPYDWNPFRRMQANPNRAGMLSGRLAQRTMRKDESQ